MTISSRSDDALVLKAYFEVSLRGSPAPHDPIFMCRHSINCFFLNLNRLVTNSSRSDDALVLKAYFEVS